MRMNSVKWKQDLLEQIHAQSQKALRIYQAFRARPLKNAKSSNASQRIQSRALIAWTIYREDSIRGKKECDVGDELQVKQKAEQKAVYDCQASGLSNCQVQSSLVTTNGRLSDDILSRYGKSNSLIVIHYGCEAEAIATGTR